MKRGYSLAGAAILLQWLAHRVYGIPQLVEPYRKTEIQKGQNWTNPIVQGWYADPDAVKFGDTYWIYATVSLSKGAQGTFDAFSSKDLVNWEKHPAVFSKKDSVWARHSLWAPSVVEHDGNYYLYYTANNPTHGMEFMKGIGVARASSPGGPFVDIRDRPIVTAYHGARWMYPMDQQIFIDDDGKKYIIWGAKRANIAPLGDDMVSLGIWEDGHRFKDITPCKRYMEAPYMIKREGIYYFMWSENDYWTANYQVAYGSSTSITGPFRRKGVILSTDKPIAEGPGHHSVFQDNNGKSYIAYHRRAVGDKVGDNRVLAIDRLVFDKNGKMRRVYMT